MAGYDGAGGATDSDHRQNAKGLMAEASSAPMNPIVTLLVGLFAAGAVLTVADLTTAQARLRRRMDKELAIVARLEVPGAKELLAGLVERHSWELVRRGQQERQHKRLLIQFVGALLMTDPW